MAKVQTGIQFASKNYINETELVSRNSTFAMGSLREPKQVS